jgi:hypothetical protein
MSDISANIIPQMAASMELRAKMTPLTVSSSQCFGNKRSVTSGENGPAETNDTATTGSASTDKPSSASANTSNSAKHKSGSVTEEELDNECESGESSDAFPSASTPMSPTSTANMSDAPPSISVAMISKLTQV